MKDIVAGRDLRVASIAMPAIDFRPILLLPLQPESIPRPPRTDIAQFRELEGEAVLLRRQLQRVRFPDWASQRESLFAAELEIGEGHGWLGQIGQHFPGIKGVEAGLPAEVEPPILCAVTRPWNEDGALRPPRSS